MDRLQVGLAVLAAAPAAWLVGVLVTAQGEFAAGLAIILVGAIVAAWALPRQRRIVGTAAMAAAAVGIGVFYGFDLFSGLANRAGAIVLFGLVLGAVGVAVDAPRGLAAGLLAMASGGLLWVYLDFVNGGWEWQAGNVLFVAGSLITAFAAWKAG